jgi:hypothetical protein
LDERGGAGGDLIRKTFLAHLGGINTDETHNVAIFYLNGIAVDDARDENSSIEACRCTWRWDDDFSSVIPSPAIVAATQHEYD